MYLYQMGVVAKILNLVPNGIDITHCFFTALFKNTLATNNDQALAVFSQKGMLTLELSSYVLETPNDAYTTLRQNLIGCSTLSQEYCKLIG